MVSHLVEGGAGVRSGDSAGTWHTAQPMASKTASGPRRRPASKVRIRKRMVGGALYVAPVDVVHRWPGLKASAAQSPRGQTWFGNWGWYAHLVQRGVA